MELIGKHEIVTPGLRRKLDDLHDAYGATLRNSMALPGVTDLHVNDDGSIWIKRFGLYQDTGEVLSLAASEKVILIVADIDGAMVEEGIVSANLPTGERFEAWLPPVTPRPVISIRVPPKVLYSLDDYVNSGIMTVEQRSIIEGVADGTRYGEPRNIIVIGGTNAGKSTLLNAIIGLDCFVFSRVIILQDIDEIRFKGRNVVRGFTGSVTLRRLMKSVLRKSPVRIIIGELRDGTALDWVMAANTGHPGGGTTIHANDCIGGLKRLERLISLASEGGTVPREEITDAVGLLVVVREVSPGVRKITEIANPIGFSNGRYEVEHLAKVAV